jgi:hypothetical protein
MGNNLLYGVIGIGGLLYFYNQNPDFKAKIDSFIQSLRGGQAAAAPSTTINNYFTNCDANGKNCTKCDSNGQNCQKCDADGTNCVDVPNVDSNTLGGGDCQTLYGGSCIGECSAGGDKDACKKCQAVCVPQSKTERKKKTKKFRSSVDSGPGKTSSGLNKKETKNLVTKGSVTGKQPKVDTNACSSKCDGLKGTGAIYDQCCASNFAKRLSYYSVGSLYTPLQNCPSQCWPWKDLNPSVYQACCHNRRRGSFHLL